MNNFKLLLTALGVGLLAVGCQKAGLNNIAVDPFQTPGHKVRLSSETVKAQVSVLVDESCFLQMRTAGIESPLLASITTKSIHLSPHKSSIQSHRVELAADVTKSQLEAWAAADPCVVGVADHVKAQANSYGSDPLFAQQTHLSSIHSLEGNKLFFQKPDDNRKDVVIAFIDSGIDMQHPDLVAQLWLNTRELNGAPGVDDDGNGFVDDIYGYNFASSIGDPSHQTVNDHGTHLAGLAAATANNVGGSGVVEKSIKIMALNVFGKNWETENVYIDQAIRYAADNGANIINISIGGYGPSETTASAIAYALNKGCVFTVAAGNKKLDIEKTFYFPASYAANYKGLISVAGFDTASNNLCDFSNFSASLVKLAAPGCDTHAVKNGLLSTRFGGEYGYKSGTSQASAIAAGSAALIYGYLRDQSPQRVNPADVERVIMSGSEHLPALVPFISGGNKLDLKQIFLSSLNTRM